MSITLCKDRKFFKKLNIYKSFASSFLPNSLDGLACLLSTSCLILTNRPTNFQISVTVNTGLSYFQKIMLAVMKVFYSKEKPNIVTYLNYRHFSNETFMSDFKNSTIQMTSKNNSIVFNQFKAAPNEAIQRHAPIKRRCVRANQEPFINEKRKTEFMKRSRLRN